MCRAWATTGISTVLAVWSLQPPKMPQKQATQHGEPFQQNETAQKERIQNSYLDTLLILQSPLEHRKHHNHLQIHHQIRTPSKDSIRTFLLPPHAECLRLESVPRSPVHHSLIREVCDNVDTRPSNIGEKSDGKP